MENIWQDIFLIKSYHVSLFNVIKSYLQHSSSTNLLPISPTQDALTDLVNMSDTWLLKMTK